MKTGAQAVDPGGGEVIQHEAREQAGCSVTRAAPPQSSTELGNGHSRWGGPSAITRERGPPAIRAWARDDVAGGGQGVQRAKKGCDRSGDGHEDHGGGGVE